MAAPAPIISVVIPTFNRAAVLAKCLDALSDQTLDRSAYEVIAIDDGSTDATCVTAKRFAGDARLRLQYVHQENRGANAARNLAVRIARGHLLLFINDDILATPLMLAHHLSVHQRYADDRVACLGRVTAHPSLPPAKLTWLHLDRAFASLSGRSELDWRSFFTCNVSVSRRLVEESGGFEEGMRYHEDLELGERMSRLGLRVIYQPKALAYHDHLLTETEFLNVAGRDARALAVWARKAPHLAEHLARLGYEPALPRTSRVKHRIAGLAVHQGTLPIWLWIARRVPPTVSYRIYGQLYQVTRRRILQRELRTSGRSRGPAPPLGCGVTL